jgi:RND superfamily putative drug exporter
VFARLGRWCHDHRWKVVLLWVAALVVGNGILAGAGGAQTNADFSLPGFESAKGGEILEESFGGQGAGFGGSIVFKADQGVDDPEVEKAMEGFFAEIEDVKGVVRVGSPYAEGENGQPGGETQIANKDPYVNKIAFAQVDFDPDLDEAEFTDAAKDINTAYDGFVDDLDVDGLQVELGGQSLAEFEAPTSELLGVAFAIFILILAFGSVLAMGLPIGMALAGIGLGSLIAGFLSFVFHPPSFAETFGLMIGLGVGIDYALFIVTRYRENLHAGHDNRESVAIALDTAGRAVVFAGTTVVISILSMVLMGLSFVTGMAIAIATVVLATMAASITLLPAFLGFAGGNIEITRRRGLVAASFAALGLIGAGLGVSALGIFFLLALLLVLPGLLEAITGRLGRDGGFFQSLSRFFAFFTPGFLRKKVQVRRDKPVRETTAYKWSRVIQHHPWSSAIIATAALVVLALPLFSLRLGASDEGNYPEDTTTRQAYDLLSEGFGPGYNGPLMLVSRLGDADDAAIDQITAAIDGTEGVDTVQDPMVLDDAVAWQVFPETFPQEKETTQLVNRLRDDVLPAAEEGTGLDVLVSGTVAINVDFTDYLSSRLPYFLGAVLILSFLLLMTVFRSILVPLKAVVMNLLSIGAAYGVMVAGFQWGWLGGILNFEEAPIEPWMPMMLFAIVFGLSMDYEVFLLSRVREEWHRTGDSRTSVADGLAVTARVITAAALIMVFVFGAFLFEDLTVIKLMGTGLATAVLLDATIVRMLLVPATMELLGDKNWWMPKWLDRILPNVDVEGHGGLDLEEQTERELEPTS